VDTESFTTLAQTSDIAACACHDVGATIAIGGNEFVGQFDGSISVRLGKPLLSQDRLTTIPLHIVGYTTSSDIPGMGQTTFDFDFSRPIPPSEVEARHEREFFPAVQTMRLHILVTTDAFKGKVLRSVSPGALRNLDARDFPPPTGSTYTLEAPIGLEDIANPGVNLAVLKKVNTGIVSTQLSPAEITTNKGFVLHSRAGKTARAVAERREIEITYETALRGPVAMTLFDEAQKSIGVAFHDVRDGGRQSIRIPNSLWQGRAMYYQISIGGLPRTGLMMLE